MIAGVGSLEVVAGDPLKNSDSSSSATSPDSMLELEAVYMSGRLMVALAMF